MLLTWALIFAVVALIAGIFGFGGVASTAAGVARILFFIFLVVFLVTIIAAILYEPAACPSSAFVLIPTRQQETPATGGGRLRASGSSAAGEGRGGNSHALELRDNADRRQEFRAQRLQCWANHRRPRQGDRRAQFCFGKTLRENYERSA